MTTATGVGSWPGDGSGGPDGAAYAEAVRTVLGEAPDLPWVPEMPGRGATAGMVGRTLAVVAELGADLQPAGWRLTSGAGVDQRRARSLLGQDLDTVEELAEGLTGAVKVQLTGPWTLAATVERPRGDKVLGDHGARRDLAQALAEGVVDHVADVRRRLPGVERLVVQLDEPALAGVMAARVPTASGFGRHRSVDRPEASEALGWVLSAIAAAGAEPWVHACAPGTDWALVRGAGARGLVVDLDVLGAADHDVLAEHLEGDGSVALGVLPGTDPGAAAAWPGDAYVVERASRWLDMLGLDPAEDAAGLVLTTACGLAGATPAWARRSTALLRSAARSLQG